MASLIFSCIFLVSLNPFGVIGGLFEPGFVHKEFTLLKNSAQNVAITKSMYKGSDIVFTIDCSHEGANDFYFNMVINMDYNKCQYPINVSKVEYAGNTIRRVVRGAKCGKHLMVDNNILKDFMIDPPMDKIVKSPITTKETKAKTTEITTTVEVAPNSVVAEKPTPKDIPIGPVNDPPPGEKQNVRRRRDVAPPTEKAETPPTTKTPLTTKKKIVSTAVGKNHFPAVPAKGVYQITLQFDTDDTISKTLTFKVNIESTSGGSYLSAMNWPLLPFYGFMSLLYLAYAIGWFVASCCNWKDLLRVQFWIGGVIGIGMLENALFYAEYQNISHTGSENGLLYFAELISCGKRALARVLVVIVSMGFGIVKPRLGQTLHKVLAVGTLYFVVAAIEGCMRVHDGGQMRSDRQTYAMIPVTVIDVALCWWVFTSLVQTTRTLRIRKNLIKLTLYRHFTNALIFTVIASLAYMVWTIKEVKFTKCMDLSSLWLQDALWPFLFALILAVTMILWRPSINNQRYAFTPLDLGISEDEDDDMTFSDAFEGMKMRGKTSESSLLNGGRNNRNKADDDLKWVEENIPSVPSTLLPTIDSDEEILTTKFEMSKMD